MHVRIPTRPWRQVAYEWEKNAPRLLGAAFMIVDVTSRRSAWGAETPIGS
jgi:hypothetical protein